MKTLVAIALLALPSALLAAPVPKEVKKEEKTEGTWQLESLNAFGRMAGIAGGQHWTLDAEGKVTSHLGPVPPANAQKNIQLVFDPKMKTCDYKYLNGNNISYPGMYELSGDTLKVACNLRGTGTRPTGADPGPDSYIWTFKRVKEEKK